MPYSQSLDPAEDGCIQQLWSAEARRRRYDVRTGRVQTIPGDKAMQRIRQEFTGRDMSFIPMHSLNCSYALPSQAKLLAHRISN